MKLSTMKKVIIICSGGMDSVTMLHDLNQCYSVVGVVSFNYGQKHKLELARGAPRGFPAIWAVARRGWLAGPRVRQDERRHP